MSASLQSALASLASHSQDTLFGQIFARSPVAMVVTRASDGLIVEPNDAFCALLGRARNDLLGRTTTALELWEQPPDRDALVAAIAREGKVDDVEVRWRTGSGEHLVLAVSMAPVDVAGCACLLLIAWDVTERRRLQDALSVAGERLSLAQRAARAGVWDWDLAAGTHYWSPELWALLALDPATNAAGLDTLETVVHPDDRALVRKALEASARTRESLNFDARYVSGGKLRWLETIGTVISDPGGRPLRMTGICVDVTLRHEAEAARLEAAERHVAILRSALDGFALLDAEGRFRDVNDAMGRMLGYSRDELLAMRFDHVDVGGPPAAASMRIGTIVAKGADRFEAQQRHKDGRVIDVEVSATYVPFGGGAIVAFQRDITARKAVEEALRTSEDRYRRLHESLTDAFVLVDMSGNLIDWNQAYQAMLGYSENELRRLTYFDLTPAKWHAMEAHIVATQILPDGQSGVYEKEYVRKDGTVIPVELRTFLLRDRDGQPEAMWAIVRNIAERKDAERQVRFMAYHDWLTGLPNRGLFFDRLSQAMSLARRNGKRVAVLFVDLDGFKGVNERFGHDAGDIVLKEAARRFASCVRAVDTAARMGGDEFVVILGELDNPAEAMSVARKLVDAIAPPIELPGHRECSVGASIGISVYPDDGTEMDTLLTAADAAMYHSKRVGGGRCVYWADVAGSREGVDIDWFDPEAHATGIAEIDRQHVELARLVNRIDSAISEHADETRLGMMFADLATKTSLHFETEESLMKRFGYPGRGAHGAAHQRLLDEVLRFGSRLSEREALFMLEWLKDWLLGHIGAEDRPLGEFLRKQANVQ